MKQLFYFWFLCMLRAENSQSLTVSLLRGIILITKDVCPVMVCVIGVCGRREEGGGKGKRKSCSTMYLEREW